MSNKIRLEDIGKLVKPKILVEAFLLCNKDVEAGEWWQKVQSLTRNSKSYKRDTIEGTFGTSLDNLFSNLNIDTYIAAICSFVIFHQGRYQFVTNKEQVDKIARSKKYFSIRAIGIKLYHSYNPITKALGSIWEPSSISTIQWFFHPRHLLDIETYEQYEKISVGDMLMFKKTQALVINIKVLKRKKFWANCSWTRKKISMLNGSTSHQVRVSTNRPFTIIKSKQE